MYCETRIRTVPAATKETQREEKPKVCMVLSISYSSALIERCNGTPSSVSYSSALIEREPRCNGTPRPSAAHRAPRRVEQAQPLSCLKLAHSSPSSYFSRVSEKKKSMRLAAERSSLVRRVSPRRAQDGSLGGDFVWLGSLAERMRYAPLSSRGVGSAEESLASRCGATPRAACMVPCMCVSVERKSMIEY